MLDNRVVSYPPPRDGLNLRASDLDRSMACTALDNGYADGELDVEEYHRRLETAKTAATRAELTALLDDLQVPHPLSDIPADSAPPPGDTGRSGHGKLIVLTIIVIVVVAVIAVVGLLGGRTTPTRSARSSPASGAVTATSGTHPDFTAADAGLLQHLPSGYGQTNCYHVDPQSVEVAALHCDPYAGRLEAAFYLYADAGTLQESYDDDRQSPAHVACSDGAQDNSYSAGRYECIMSNGSAVVPTVEWTSNRQDVLGVYFAPGASGAATVLSWWKQHNQLR